MEIRPDADPAAVLAAHIGVLSGGSGGGGAAAVTAEQVIDWRQKACHLS